MTRHSSTRPARQVCSTENATMNSMFGLIIVLAVSMPLALSPCADGVRPADGTAIGAATSTADLGFRPPAVPLVANDPYFSIWSCADHLTEDSTRHWTGVEQALTSLIRVDGKSYRLMGSEPRETPALPQVGLQILPTRTIYDFEGPEVRVTLTFMTPSLPNDLDAV